MTRADNSYSQAAWRTCSGSAFGDGNVQRGNSRARISVTNHPMQGTSTHHARENFQRPVISVQQGCGLAARQGKLIPTAAVHSTPAARQTGSTQPNMKYAWGSLGRLAKRRNEYTERLAINSIPRATQTNCQSQFLESSVPCTTSRNSMGMPITAVMRGTSTS